MSRTPRKARTIGKSSNKASKPTAKTKAPKRPLASREITAVSRKLEEEEPTSQVTLKLRQSQHQQLAQMAFEAGTTMRGIIMRALKSKGLSVTKEDLKDRRRR